MLRNKPAKNMRVLYNVKYKTLKKVSVEDTRKMKDNTQLWVKKLNLVKMAMLSKAIYRFYGITAKIQTPLLTNIENNQKYYVLVQQFIYS